MNGARASGVSALPMNVSSSAVAPMTGAIPHTRMLSGASSTASALVMRLTAPFELLYQVNPGRGRRPAVLPTLIITPPPMERQWGTTACVMWKIESTLMA